MRPIERDYLKTFADRITPEVWGEVVDAALTAAKEGDAKAREWITRLVLGSDPMQLSGLARREQAGIGAQEEMAAEVEIDHTDWMVLQMEVGASATPLKVAEHRRLCKVAKEQAEAELERRKQEREARKALKAGTAAGDANDTAKTAKNLLP